MKKIVSLLVLLVFLGTWNVQAGWFFKNEEEKPTQVIVHNKTGENISTYLKYSKWVEVGKFTKAAAKATLITVGNILVLSSTAATGNPIMISYSSVGYSTGNGAFVLLGKGKLNPKTNKRQETTYTSNSDNGIIEIYIKQGLIQGVNTNKKLKNFTKSAQLIDDFKIEGKKKLQSKIHVKKHKTVHIYIEKNKRKYFKKRGRYKVWATQPK